MVSCSGSLSGRGRVGLRLEHQAQRVDHDEPARLGARRWRATRQSALEDRRRCPLRRDATD
jgi:hypothetical protein